MEGMISRDLCDTQEDQYMAPRDRLSCKNWKQTLVIKLLEVTHGQWLYRNVHVHDSISGKHALEQKEKLRHALLDQLDLGDEELDEQDKYLLEINLGDLDTSTGDDQEYWLLVTPTAKETRRIRLREESACTLAPLGGGA